MQMTVSPDFSPDHIAGWYVFNTWLQRKLGIRCHLELYDDFQAQHAAIAADRVDLIFANPYDASTLVRDKGFVSIAAPIGAMDEAVVAVAAESAVYSVDDLRPGLRIGQTRDPDVNLIGMMLLEPADLQAEHVVAVTVPSYVLVARHLLLDKVDAGFFLKQAYDDLSPTTRHQLRPLVTSQISVLRHTLLAGPALVSHADALRRALLGMSEPGSDGSRALQALGLQGWEVQTIEDTEYMIDLISALQR